LLCISSYRLSASSKDAAYWLVVAMHISEVVTHCNPASACTHRRRKITIIKSYFVEAHDIDVAQSHNSDSKELLE